MEHGVGHFKMGSDGTYQGDFKNGEQHGKGVLTSDDLNKIYTGEFFKG